MKMKLERWKIHLLPLGVVHKGRPHKGGGRGGQADADRCGQRRGGQRQCGHPQKQLTVTCGSCFLIIK